MTKAKKSAPQFESTVPVTIAAKASLEDRLKAVWQRAPKAAKKATEDVENVHQLRVSVRRASAAMELYAPLLPTKRTRVLKKQLRALRKAAGPARDLDILKERVEKHSAESTEPAFAALLEFVRARRAAAQRPVKRAYVKAKRQDFRSNAKSLAKSAKWRGDGAEPDFGTFARAQFEPMTDRFFAAARVDMSDIEALHQLRIEGKTVRYAIDLLSSAFGGKFAKRNSTVFAKLQNKLGDINDHASAVDFYEGLLKAKGIRGCKPAIREMIEFEKTQLESSREDFSKWWSIERVSEMQQQFADAISLDDAGTIDQEQRPDAHPSEAPDAEASSVAGDRQRDTTENDSVATPEEDAEVHANSRQA